VVVVVVVGESTYGVAAFNNMFLWKGVTTTQEDPTCLKVTELRRNTM